MTGAGELLSKLDLGLNCQELQQIQKSFRQRFTFDLEGWRRYLQDFVLFLWRGIFFCFGIHRVQVSGRKVPRHLDEQTTGIEIRNFLFFSGAIMNIEQHRLKIVASKVGR